MGLAAVVGTSNTHCPNNITGTEMPGMTDLDMLPVGCEAFQSFSPGGFAVKVLAVLYV